MNKFSFTRLLISIISFGFSPVRYLSHTEIHKFEQFKANVQDLLGEHPAKSVLSHLCLEEMGAGDGVWIDGIDALNSDDATTAALTAKSTRQAFHELASGSQDWAAYLLTKTPHMAVSKIRTQSLPQLNEWGHYFDEDEGWQHLVDPKGKEVNVGVRKLHLTRDQLFSSAVVAPTATRITEDSTDRKTTVSVRLPANQILADITQSSITATGLSALLCEKFEDVWFAKGQPIFCAISAKTKRLMLTNERSVIHNRDFVSSYAHFMQGTLPEIDGVTYIVLPTSFMSDYNGIADPSFSGTISSVSDGTTNTICNCAADHGLLTGDVVTVAGTTNHNGTYTITYVDSDSFSIEDDYVEADSGTYSGGGSTAVDNFFAWTPQAITKVTYKGMRVSEGVSPDHRFDTAVYAREKVDFVRTDDKGVVVGDLI